MKQIVVSPFECNYDITLLSEMGSEKRYYYPPNLSASQDGLAVKVKPSSQQKSWIGVFAFEDLSPKAVTSVYTFPDPNKFCVIARGAGYIAHSGNPDSWEEVDCLPILDIYPILEQGILLFANFSELVAYDASGLKWCSESLPTVDGLKILSSVNSHVEVELWSMQLEEKQIVKLDLESGRLIA